jgi:hypothetical protein
MPDVVLMTAAAGALSLGDGGGWAAFVATAALIVTAVWRGWLIPRPTYQDRMSDLKETITALRATVDERERQISILLGQRVADRPPDPVRERV